jgi:hypothetical protein
MEQLALIARLPTHHSESPLLIVSSGRNHCSPKIARPFQQDPPSGRLLIHVRNRTCSGTVIRPYWSFLRS